MTRRARIGELDGGTGRRTGYRPGRTLPLRVELVRQLRRRRTQVAFGLVALLPVILWVAFELAADGPPTGSLNLVDLAKGSGANFAVFALFASASFLLVVVVALFFGDTVASEASWSSLRYLLAAPIPRARLLRQKAIVAGLLSVSALLAAAGGGAGGRHARVRRGRPGQPDRRVAVLLDRASAGCCSARCTSRCT